VNEKPKGWCYDHISPIPYYEIGLNNELFHHEPHGLAQPERVENSRIRLQDIGPQTGSSPVTCGTEQAGPLARSPSEACPE